MAKMIIRLFGILTYMCIGLAIGQKNVQSKEFWEKIEKFPERHQLSNEQIIKSVLVMCAIFWPWFAITEMIRKIRNK